MTQTLTTEQLKNLIEFNGPDHDASSANADSWEVHAMARELLANREAQPVAWRHDDGPFAGMALTRSKSVADSWIANGWTVTPLFVAPPAPAVPDAISTRQAIANMESHEPCDSINVAYKHGWNACRAAMLKAESKPCKRCHGEGWMIDEMGITPCICRRVGNGTLTNEDTIAQPVRQGYKLPDGFKLMPIEMTDEIAEAIALEARCCGGIALCIYEAALAAADRN